MFTIRRVLAFAADRDALLDAAVGVSRPGGHGTAASRWRRMLVLVALTLSNTVAHAADKLTPADRQAIEQTIRSQLEAFGREDADRAFNFASPDIQRMFRSSDAFLQMVREHYEPVYRAGGVHFVKLDTVDGQWIQTVQIVDDEGRVWRALFTMRRQPDKSWKVGGCQLVQTSAIAT